jgi:hypothetical protein
MRCVICSKHFLVFRIIDHDEAFQFYYWDSYFCGLGLLVDGKREMAINIVEHFIFQIKHYNKVSSVRID